MLGKKIKEYQKSVGMLETVITEDLKKGMIIKDRLNGD
jgi:hypothetical protein